MKWKTPNNTMTQHPTGPQAGRLGHGYKFTSIASTSRKVTTVPGPNPQAPAQPPIENLTDPRWVLAVRVAQSLQGTIITPERRDRLIRIGKMLGLTAFDANLVVAMIQDQARRGHAPDDCPQVAYEQLCMIPPPHHGSGPRPHHGKLRLPQVIAVTLATVTLELFLGWWLLHHWLAK